MRPFPAQGLVRHKHHHRRGRHALDHFDGARRDGARGHHGTWVPASAACTSPLKLVIDANMVTFVNGAQRAEYRQLEQCFTCMGRDVTNVTMLSTDAMGDSPFMIYLDASKKKATVRTDFSNDKKLGARFPFGTAALKHCP
jgi:hypothetical protein